ncbi:MAG: hypothetical protein ACLGI2_04685 [Acidimicrobiia bacterium]
MTAPPLRPRPYPATPGLVRRTAADFSAAERRSRGVRGHLIQADLDLRPAEPRLVSTAHGRIERMLLTVPSYAVQSPPLAAVYGSLLRTLRPEVALTILTHESVEGTVSGWRRGDDDVVLAVPDHLLFSVWAEDGYVMALGDGGRGDTWFVEPYAFPRYGDGLVAELVSNGTGLRKAQAPLYFQGGNVLIGDDFVLLGADYPAESLEYVGDVLAPAPGESPAGLVRRLYSEYLDTSRRLLYLGSTIPVPAEDARPVGIDGQQWTEIVHTGNAAATVQPVFHIDMFVTLAGRGDDGRYRVLVGDPSLAARLVGERVAPHAMPEVFDSIAAVLGRLGFDVVRNPLPLVYVDDPAERLRIWYFATANNALVEPGRVILPTYGHGAWGSLEVVDRANAELWRSLGFEVAELADCHPLAEALGSVHCIKKYVRRST